MSPEALERRRASSRARHRKNRADAAKRGMCMGCYKRKPAKGKNCERCLERLRKYAKKRREEVAEGDCKRCYIRPASDGLKTCADCRNKGKLVLRNLRAEAIEFGMCSVCRARPTADGRRCCEYCSTWRFRRKANQEWLDGR